MTQRQDVMLIEYIHRTYTTNDLRRFLRTFWRNFSKPWLDMSSENMTPVLFLVVDEVVRASLGKFLIRSSFSPVKYELRGLLDVVLESSDLVVKTI